MAGNSNFDKNLEEHREDEPEGEGVLEGDDGDPEQRGLRTVHQSTFMFAKKLTSLTEIDIFDRN